MRVAGVSIARARVGTPAILLLLTLLSGATAGTAAAEDREMVREGARRAEMAFARTVAENDLEAFAAFLDEDAVFVGSDGAKVGKEAIVEAWKGFFGDERPFFTWAPEIVELSGDGTLALTRGPWLYRGKNAEGKLVEQEGIFNSVWRRQEDGSWKVVFDAGCSPCPTCPE